MDEDLGSTEYRFDNFHEASERLYVACEKIQELVMAVDYFTEKSLICTADAQDCLLGLMENVFSFYAECGPVLIAYKKVINSVSDGPCRYHESCDVYGNAHEIIMNIVTDFIRHYCINFPVLRTLDPKEENEELIRRQFNESVTGYQVAFDVDPRISLLREPVRWKLFWAKFLPELIKKANWLLYGEGRSRSRLRSRLRSVDFDQISEIKSRLVSERDRLWMKNREMPLDKIASTKVEDLATIPKKRPSVIAESDKKNLDKYLNWKKLSDDLRGSKNKMFYAVEALISEWNNSDSGNINIIKTLKSQCLATGDDEETAKHSAISMQAMINKEIRKLTKTK